jgi:hypothetical protein
MMAREGLIVESQTLWDQLNAMARHLEPTYVALGRRALDAPVINVDETRWAIMGSAARVRSANRALCKRSQVLWLVLRDVVAVVAAGLVTGIIAAVWSAQALTSLLHEVQPAHSSVLARWL